MKNLDAQPGSLNAQSVFMPVGMAPKEDELALIQALTQNKKQMDRQLAEGNGATLKSQRSNGQEMDFLTEFL